jgi:hypothetical protein
MHRVSRRKSRQNWPKIGKRRANFGANYLAQIRVAIYNFVFIHFFTSLSFTLG